MRALALLLCLMFVTPIAAIEFDGVDDYVDCGSSPLSLGTGDFTAACWFKTTKTSFQYLIAEGGDSGASSKGFGIAMQSGGQLYGFIHDGTRQVFGSLGSGYNDDSWHFYVVVFDRDGDVSFYLDGTDIGGEDISSRTASIDSANTLAIGEYLVAAGEFDGLIDDVRIYNRVLSANEVAALYAATRKRNKKLIGGTLGQGLVGHWRMLDGPVGADASGTANILDSSGNGNHGDDVEGATTGTLTFTAPANN